MDGDGPNSRFDFPSGIAVDASGNIIVADTNNNRIRRILTNGTVTTLAGNGTPGFSDGNGADVMFNQPNGVFVRPNGAVLVADTLNHRIRRVAPDGSVVTVAGWGSAGSADGVGGSAMFNRPNGITFDLAGNMLVTDDLNRVVRKISPYCANGGTFNLPMYSCDQQGMQNSCIV
jgi:sugar lactone lactonase YvrE